MVKNPDTHANPPSDQSLQHILWENAPLIVMYAVGTVLFIFVSLPLALIYSVYCILSTVVYMAYVCPYCPHHTTRTCPAGYHYISHFFKPRNDKDFAHQFRRIIFLLFPQWFLPPVAGLYLLILDFHWVTLILVLLFCLVGFWILPESSKRNCKQCENAENCPRGKNTL